MKNNFLNMSMTISYKGDEYRFIKKVHAETNPNNVEVDLYEMCHKHYPLFVILFNNERKFKVEFSIDKKFSKNYEISYEREKAKHINRKFNAVLHDFFESVKTM